MLTWSNGNSFSNGQGMDSRRGTDARRNLEPALWSHWMAPVQDRAD